MNYQIENKFYLYSFVHFCWKWNDCRMSKIKRSNLINCLDKNFTHKIKMKYNKNKAHRD